MAVLIKIILVCLFLGCIIVGNSNAPGDYLSVPCMLGTQAYSGHYETTSARTTLH